MCDVSTTIFHLLCIRKGSTQKKRRNSEEKEERDSNIIFCLLLFQTDSLFFFYICSVSSSSLFSNTFSKHNKIYIKKKEISSSFVLDYKYVTLSTNRKKKLNHNKCLLCIQWQMEKKKKEFIIHVT